jgi:hypothetical protein
MSSGLGLWPKRYPVFGDRLERISPVAGLTLNPSGFTCRSLIDVAFHCWVVANLATFFLILGIPMRFTPTQLKAKVEEARDEGYKLGLFIEQQGSRRAYNRIAFRGFVAAIMLGLVGVVFGAVSHEQVLPILDKIRAFINA